MKTRTKRIGLGWCIALTCAFMLAQAPEAEAGDAGFIFELDVESVIWYVDVPQFELTNTSAPGWELVSFSITLGDTAYQFDQVYTPFNVTDNGGLPLTPTIVAPSPNTNADGSADDSIVLSFTGFDSGESVDWDADVDLDGASGDITPYNAFYNNGVGNATVFIGFTNGQEREGFEFQIPDNRNLGGPFIHRDGHQLPEPASLALLGIGAIGFAVRRRRRKTA